MILETMYTEKHHIIPRCMGGSDDPSNLVELTPEAHLLAHFLLAQLFPEHAGLNFAYFSMCNYERYEIWDEKMASQYKISREKHAEWVSKNRRGEKNPNYGKSIKEIMSEEGYKNFILSKTGKNNHNYGKKLRKETRRKISESLKGNKRSKETRRKISESLKGFRHSDESKAKMANGRKGGNNGNADRNIYRFKHKEGQTFEGTRYEFLEKYHISSTVLRNFKSGKQKSIKGWTSDFTPISGLMESV